MKEMSDNKYNLEKSVNLREKAEARLKKTQPKTAPKLSEDDTQKLLHELQVHQIELELLNEELMLAKNSAEDEAEKYTQLYDFSPSGCFTLSRDGKIMDLNLSGAKMLGKDRQSLKNRRFGVYVSGDTKRIFNHFIEKVFAGKAKEICEVTLSTNCDLPIYVQLWGVLSENSEQCLLTVADITERKNAEKALQEVRDKLEQRVLDRTNDLQLSEEKFRTVADFTYDWEYWEGTNHQLLYISPSCEKITGYKADEFLSDKSLLKKIIHPEDRKLMEDHLEKTHSKEHAYENYELDYRIVKKNGTIAYIGHTCMPVYDSKGNDAGRRISNRDITERKEAENLLEQTRKNYNSFFNTIDEFLFVLDEQGNIIHTNETVLQRLEYSHEELLGKSVLMAHPPERREEAGRTVFEMLSGKANFCPVPLISKSGIQIPVETRVTRGVWDGRAVLFGVSKDVSRIVLSEEKFSKAFQTNAALMAISTIDEGRYLDVNDTFLNVLGYSREEVIGRTSAELNINSDPAERNKIVDRIKQNIKVKNIEIEVNKKDTGKISGLFSADPIYLGKDQYLLTAMIDITERKKAEALRQEDLDRLKKIASRVPGVVYQYCLRPDGSSCFPFASEAINEIYRVSPDEVRQDASKVLANIHPDDYSGTVESIQKSAQDLSPWQHDYRVRFDDGTIRSLYGNALPQREEDGSVLWHGFITDVTERLEQQEILRKEKERLQSVILGTNAGTWEWNVQTGETVFNNKWAEIVGYTLEELEPISIKTWEKLAHPDDLAKSGKHLKAHFNKKSEFYSVDSRMKHKDGSWVWVSDRGRVIEWDKEGKPLKMFGTHMDITKKKQTEEKLAVITERLSLATEVGGVGIWDYDIVNNKLIWDDRMFALYGIKREQFSGAYEAWQSGLHPDDKIRGGAEIQMAIKGEKEFNTEFRVLWADGTIRTIHALAKVERNALGEPLRMIGTNWDITESKNAQEAIVQLYKEIKVEKKIADNANKAKSDFIARMSHELRTPLNSIIGFSELLYDELFGTVNTKQKEYLGDVLSSGKHLLDLINEILDISKIEAGKMELNVSNVNISTFLRNSTFIVKEACFRKKLKLRIEAGDNLVEIQADEKKLKQSLFNLLSNAVKFTPDGGEITIGAYSEDKNMVIFVRDTGIGIEEKDKEKIFTSFQQIDSALSRKYEGSGLGLALSKGFIELHGGRMRFESEGKDKGSTFFMSIPIFRERLETKKELTT